MEILSEFIWLGEPDNKETHLELIKGQTYKTSSISTSLLLAWRKQGKILFTQNGEFEKPEKIEVETPIVIPEKKPDTVLSVKSIFHKFIGKGV
jgi:hypothetical protein